MANITIKQVEKIASLSKLCLKGDELEKLTQDFNQMLNFVEIINEIDIECINFTNIVSKNFITQQEVYKSQTHVPIESTKKIAPKFGAGYFIVPRVIENNG